MSRNDLFGAVAVVRIEVDDRDSPCAVPAHRPVGADGHIVQIAEPAGLRARRMVPGRAHGAKCVLDAARIKFVDRLDHGSRALHGGVKGLGTHARVGSVKGRKRARSPAEAATRRLTYSGSCAKVTASIGAGFAY